MVFIGMSEDKLKNFQEKLHVLQNTYVTQLPEKLFEIRELWGQFSSGEHSDVQDLRRAVHSLAGSGATFGFSDISVVARELEDQIRSLPTVQPPTEEDALVISTHIEKLATVFTEVSDNKICSATTSQGLPIITTRDGASIQNNRVYVIEDDEEVSEYIANMLNEHGYHVEKFSEGDALIQRSISHPPAVVVVDIILYENDMGGIDLACELREKGVHCPLIAITIKNDLDTRVKASKAGIKYFFTKPLDSISFVNTITDLVNPEKEAPYRILIVDDDKTLADYYSLALKKSGMLSEVLSDPQDIIKTLDKFMPELILMDIYMPGYSGKDLASVIRQNRNYDNVPIVFLSQESDFWKKTSALHLGGDDFITKPIMPEHLAITVLARVKRARQLSSSRYRLESVIAELERYKLGLDEHAIVSVTDREGKISYANSKFVKLTGYSLEELIGRNHSMVNSGHHSAEYFGVMWDAISNGNVWQGTIKNRNKDGEYYWVETTIVPYMDTHGIPYQYMAIRTDITEQVSAKEDAENANRAKSDFLSSMSHELRTPLNAILGFSHLLEEDENTSLDDTQKENIHEIHKAGDHLLFLINEILDLSKIEAGKMDVSFDPVALDDVIIECRDLVIPISNEMKVSVEYELSASNNKYVLGDRVRIKQALLNLVTNAVKYNKRGGRVDISTSLHAGNKLRVSVIDTGKGIANEKFGQLFKPFNRLDEKITETEGTGIGLVITKRLVELMRGEIGVQSSVGIGSTFWLELELTQPNTGKSKTDLDSKPKINKEVIANQHNLLYIEDNRSNVKLVEKLLNKRKGISMCAAYMPEEGIDIADKTLPDIILLDINLPGMDGYEVLKILKDSDRTRHIPVIALSANAMPSDIKYGLDTGFNYYLTKPINVKQFFSTLDTVISEL